MCGTMKKQNKGFKFQPFSDRQIQLLTWWIPGASPYADYDGVIAEGSIRAGKTIAMMDSFINWSISTFDGENFILGGKTMGALKRNVLNPMFQILNTKGIEYKYIRSDDPRIEIGNNVYYIFGGDNEKSQDKVQGLTAAGAYLDEVALMPKSFVDQVMGRCSVDGAKYFFNCNPGHPKHWLKTEFIDKPEEKNFLVLHFTMDDNLSLSDKVKERLKRMFSGVFYLRYILGQWVIAEGLVYGEYKPKEHNISKNQVIEMLQRSDFKLFIAGTDFGVSSPMTGNLYGITRSNKVYQIAEYYKRNSTTDNLAKWYKEQEEWIGKKIYAIYCDSAEPDRIFDLRKHGLRAVEGVKEIDAGINTVKVMLKNNQLYICEEECPNTANEITTYSYPPADDPKANQDKPIDADNHSMDGKRYCLHTHFRRRKTG
jgi:PBSX family phage terminase large subunit